MRKEKLKLCIIFAICGLSIVGCTKSTEHTDADAYEISGSNSVNADSKETEVQFEDSSNDAALESRQEQSDISQVNDISRNQTVQQLCNIVEIADDAIIVSKVNTWETDDGAGLAVMYVGEESETFEVSISSLTRYEIHEIRNGGVNGKEDVTVIESSKNDLKKGDLLEVGGYWEGDILHAESIVITHVV